MIMPVVPNWVPILVHESNELITYVLPVEQATVGEIVVTMLTEGTHIFCPIGNEAQFRAFFKRYFFRI